MSSSSVDFVYFDLDDTILDHRSAQDRALQDLCADGGPIGGSDVSAVSARYHDINVELWRGYARGALDRATVETQRFARLLRDLDAGRTGPSEPAAPDDRSRAVSAAYMQRYAAHWRLLPGAREGFEAAAERWPVGIITNGFAEVQREKLRRFPFLLERARVVVISEEVGVMKPHPDLFRHAEREAGIAGNAVLYVGDSWESDILGAARAGWRTIWLHPRAVSRPPATYAVRRWEAFPL